VVDGRGVFPVLHYNPAMPIKNIIPGQTVMKQNITHQTPRDKVLHWAYEMEIWVKGFDATLEVIGGLILLLASNLMLNQLVISLTQHELVEDPRDVIATLLRQSVANISVGAHIFGGAYLVIHGLTKLCLVTGLLRRKAWAYPATIGFLCVFIAYQLYRVSYQFSLGLVLLTFFDAAFVFLIGREYRLLKNKATKNST
jgi:uncharacterized membrane protein